MGAECQKSVSFCLRAFVAIYFGFWRAAASCQTTAILSYLNHSENVIGASRNLASRSGWYSPFLDGNSAGSVVPDVD
jgi:hypothetical protein